MITRAGGRFNFHVVEEMKESFLQVGVAFDDNLPVVLFRLNVLNIIEEGEPWTQQQAALFAAEVTSLANRALSFMMDVP